MREQKKREFKNILCVILCFLMLMGMNPVQLLAANTGEQDEKTKALDWLEKQATDGEWYDDGLPNMTCDTFAVMELEQREKGNDWLSDWKEEQDTFNNDEIAHLIWSGTSPELIPELVKRQNEDGGFGLDERYRSDYYDTALALWAVDAYSSWQEAGISENSIDKEKAVDVSGIMERAAAYLAKGQRSDGGYGYTALSDTDAELTAEIGIALQASGCVAEKVLEKLDKYCAAALEEKLTEEKFICQAKTARYLFMRDALKDSEKLKQQLLTIQKENGSVFDSEDATVEYILLLNALEESEKLRFSVKDMKTECDTYVLEADKQQTVSINTVLSYSVNQEFEGNVVYTLLEDGEESVREEVVCGFEPGKKVTHTSAQLEVKSRKDAAYVLQVSLQGKTDGEECIYRTEEIPFSVHVREIPNLVLYGNVNTGEDYGISLVWNDISDEEERYGYRVFRKQSEQEWETRSTWDGTEKVRVLNIYPDSYPGPCLKKWMEQTIAADEEPAGKGLFEIDEVLIDRYNIDPNQYLLDEAGNYKYDVLMIGSSDCNSGRDLNEKSYIATKTFIDAGRGVLFGHDTVVKNPSQVHPWLAKFVADAGAELIPSGRGTGGSKVKVINTGFLTSYPWKITGTLVIPYAHTSGQGVTEASGGTVWMEFDTSNTIDEDTGANIAPYLFSKNSVAMIQTGHSMGQASDDERKILANTLFYLKQLSNKTTAEDKSFYDEAAPEVEEIQVSGNSCATLTAQDYGTDYQYYVQAVPSGRDHIEETIQSNTVSMNAISGVKGFIVGVSESEEAMPELIQYSEEGTLLSEVMNAENGQCTYDLSDYEPGSEIWLHVYAVDYAGNVSKEKVSQLILEKEEPESGYFDSPYAMLAGNGIAKLSCSEANITGDVYGRDSFQFQGSILRLDGTASAAGALSIAGGLLEVSSQESGSTVLEMPQYMERILGDMEAQEVEEIASYNSTEIVQPTYCAHTTGAWCNEVNINAFLVCGDSISFNANTVTSGREQPVVLASENGNITIQATSFSGSGLIYAPNGTVTINVSDFKYKGNIIAGEIRIQTSNYNQSVQGGTEE